MKFKIDWARFLKVFLVCMVGVFLMPLIYNGPFVGAFMAVAVSLGYFIGPVVRDPLEPDQMEMMRCMVAMHHVIEHMTTELPRALGEAQRLQDEVELLTAELAHLRQSGHAAPTT